MKRILLYVPFIFGWALLSNPQLSFWISWCGSVLLVLSVITGLIGPVNDKGKWLDHPLRPLFIPHFIFAGYMSISSVFYFWSLLGYEYLEKIHSIAAPDLFERTALAQSLYCLGHTGFLHGLLIASHYKTSNIRVNVHSITTFSLRLAIVFFVLGLGLQFAPQFGQFTERAGKLSTVSASIALALAIPERKTSSLLLALVVFGFNMLQALLSGWKENILVLFILLAAFLLPVYRWRVVLAGIPVLLMIMFVLPTFNAVFRENAWKGGVNREEALKTALNAVQEGGNIENTNWDFLVVRSSEIGIFEKYLNSVPKQVPFYGAQIIEQSIASLFPRILYPNKPITENLVMARVRENRIIEHYSKEVSAKPQIVVDGYLSFGLFGAWLFCFITGWSAARISVWAEQLFGGYFLGTGIMFSALFNVYWRGNCLEFFLNTVVWSMVIMVVIYYVFQMTGIIDTKAAKAR